MDTEALQKLVEEFFSKLGASVEVKVSQGHRTLAAVTSADATLLIGPNGEYLRAINALLRRIAEKVHGEGAATFLVDINGYHEGQMERVRSAARVLAQRVRLFKHDVEMEPTSSYERLVVHELFAEDPEIETSSEGEGKFRHVVLRPRGSHKSPTI